MYKLKIYVLLPELGIRSLTFINFFCSKNSISLSGFQFFCCTGELVFSLFTFWSYIRSHAKYQVFISFRFIKWKKLNDRNTYTFYRIAVTLFHFGDIHFLLVFLENFIRLNDFSVFHLHFSTLSFNFKFSFFESSFRFFFHFIIFFTLAFRAHFVYLFSPTISVAEEVKHFQSYSLRF